MSDYNLITENKDMSDDYKGGDFGTILADAAKEERMGFVRKVYGILSTQLVLTFGCVALMLGGSVETAIAI